MQDPGWVLETWGYVGISAVVILGNMGLPIPEETILILGGYLVWEGKLRFPIVIGVGLLSAVLGDNLGYWIGHKFGRRAVERYERWFFVTTTEGIAGHAMVSATADGTVAAGWAAARPASRPQTIAVEARAIRV